MTDQPLPRVVLLIPHYNNPQGLERSLASIGKDEVCDVLVVDDGSNRAPIDHNAARAAFAARGIVRFLNLPQNRGIEHALNSGLQWIQARGYELVARLDCGDLNVPDRLARQLAFLDAHPAVMLVGGAASMVDPQGVEQFVLRHPAAQSAIVKAMRANSAFIHPTVMFRSAALAQTGLYPLDTPAAEDYALFWEFVNRFETANLPEVLIRYELDPTSISHSKRDKQLRSRLKLQRRHSDGSAAALAGIARTAALLAMPYKLVFKLKSRLRKERA
ncbi:Glycosyl transferase family 2 [Andreprevotia lacus DSM 23236]|jgi:glycosyltransferase involved in cell wall biosynthesis|uniref:Glycosyl transferase family 2 n=1 Tax=Andreprevotia lacus DSM 23236 TaxID=1121001 RepID=A0A1W1XXW5_9NEIS|nr:glycosyltransferase [Andreprevotia lacus]SMC28697.1 Glycosyl transferase family 2 [Andreprevotia lacus DSM 23236]